jgi:hypothetical protein
MNCRGAADGRDFVAVVVPRAAAVLLCVYRRKFSPGNQ